MKKTTFSFPTKIYDKKFIHSLVAFFSIGAANCTFGHFLSLFKNDMGDKKAQRICL